MVLSVLALVLSLAACKTIYIEKKVLVEPPQEFLEECPVVGLKKDATVEDGLISLTSNIESVLKCNADKRSVKNWFEQTKKNMEGAK